MTKPKKWIADRIASLDPETDYVEMWQLMSSYGHTEFMAHLIYALTFQNFIVTEWGAEAVWRDDGGKVLERGFSRVDQTAGANLVWWFYGPHDERTKKSTEAINKLHEYWAKRLPGVFSYNDDYIYTCAYTAVFTHRFQQMLGLPGYTDKEKVAAHLFWRDMSTLFFAENRTPLHGYPEDFDALMAFCEEYEHLPRPKPERTNLIVTAFHEQFAMRFFPEDMRWLAHQLLRSLSLPTTLETAQIDPPHPMAKELLPKLMGFVLAWQVEHNDDPETSFIEDYESATPEDKRARRLEMGKLDKAFPEQFAKLHGDDPRFAGCPFHAALRSAPPKDEPTEIRELAELDKVSAPHV